MRIAQVAPLIESVPPKHYGGTERIVSYLTEELVRAGHDVTLFGSGDSVTSARLIAPTRRSLRKNERCKDPMAREVILIDHVVEHAREFDVIHFHTGYLHFAVSRHLPIPHVTTLHGRLDMLDLIRVFDRFRDVPVISISDSQREPVPWANWQATIYHGLPNDLFRFYPDRGDYLAFLGRTSPEKGADRAIEIAKRVDMPLKIAAKVDCADRRYFKRVDWPEFFGLVMIEAMACGTPVIAYESGSVPEVMEDGITGFVVRELDEAAEAIGRVRTVDRARCREVFENRFTATRMADDYTEVYHQMVGRTAVDYAEVAAS
jgi:glycosyltransferase involved in cell wall biosynthesis